MKIIIILIINKCKLLYIIIDNKIFNYVYNLFILNINVFKIDKYNIK